MMVTIWPFIPSAPKGDGNESTRHPKGFEVAVGEALAYLDFNVIPMAGNGEPEGIAKLFPYAR